MNELLPSYFFDLTHYKHASLFQQREHVWDALKLIDLYLKSAKLGLIEGEVDPRAFIIHPELISIGRGTVVEPGAYIKGPCIIGENCQIRHGAYIRGDAIIGNGCVIGHDTEVKHSILLDFVQAAHFAYLGDTILGNNVNLGAGTKCANLRLDHGLIHVNHSGKHIQTGLKKLGAILGDRVQMGCNSVTNPGTLMGKECFCYPCTNVSGWIASHQQIKYSNDLHVTSLGGP